MLTGRRELVNLSLLLRQVMLNKLETCMCVFDCLLACDCVSVSVMFLNSKVHLTEQIRGGGCSLLLFVCLYFVYCCL